MKKVFSLIVSLVLCILCYPAMIVESAVIEPKLVHTERWTTSYYLDDDTDTLYPYVQCVANIYSNGTVYVYMWNTHEWTTYADKKNKLTILQSAPYRDDTFDYDILFNGKTFLDNNDHGITLGSHDIDYGYKLDKKQDIDISFYPKTYESWNKYSYGNGGDSYWGTTVINNWGNYISEDLSFTDIGKYSYTEKVWSYAPMSDSVATIETKYREIEGLSTETSLGLIQTYSDSYNPLVRNYYDDEDELELYVNIKDVDYRHNWVHKFTTDDVETLNSVNRFRLYGHDITITPEMLNNTVSTVHDETGGVSEELEKYKALYEESESKLKELEADSEYKDKIINTLGETITALESQVEHWKKHCGDCDDDGRISISDSIILNRYLAGTVDSLPCSDPPPLAPEDEGSD